MSFSLAAMSGRGMAPVHVSILGEASQTANSGHTSCGVFGAPFPPGLGHKLITVQSK